MTANSLSRSVKLMMVSILLAGAGSGGCARESRIVLQQAAAPPAQREIKLASHWSFTGCEDGRRNSLFAFPLPGSKDGPRDFLVYVSAPDVTGETAVNPADAAAARGFLVQAVGQLAGKAVFAEGTIRNRSVLFAPSLRRIDLDVRCTDDTRISGTVYAETKPHEVSSFERRYAADVALTRSTVSIATAPRATQAAASQPAERDDESGGANGPDEPARTSD